MHLLTATGPPRSAQCRVSTHLLQPPQNELGTIPDVVCLPFFQNDDLSQQLGQEQGDWKDRPNSESGVRQPFLTALLSKKLNDEESDKNIKPYLLFEILPPEPPTQNSNSPDKLKDSDLKSELRPGPPRHNQTTGQ
jgi:hypothetical protein